MDYKELKERQGWTLEQKIDHSLGVIDQFVGRLGLEHTYVSFSGGKDSTIVLWLARKLYPDIKAVFCNTGNEYPDLVRFVREERDLRGANIEIIQPKIKPKDVLSIYGFPLISKDISEKVWYARNKPSSERAKLCLGQSKSAFYSLSSKYKYLLKEKYEIHSQCCKELKEKPLIKFGKANNIFPIIGIMAEESLRRTTMYIRQGQCNTFGEQGGKIKSMPLSIWLEGDIWNCIEKYHIPISDIYRKGATRTGCMFCGYGCQFKNDNRLQLVHDLYPKWYETFMNYTNNGVTYREAMRKVLAVNGLSLPDENIQLDLNFK